MTEFVAAQASSLDISTDGKREMLDLARARALLAPGNPATLTHVKLGTKSFGHDAVEAAFELLSKCEHLRVADLADIIAGRPTDEGLAVLRRISEALAGKDVATLDLSDNALGPRGVEACRGLLTGLETLEDVAFCNDGLSAEACDAIADMLLFRAPTRLRRLHFFNNMSGDGGGVAIGRILAQSPNMADFRMSSVRCAAEGGAALFASLASCRRPV